MKFDMVVAFIIMESTVCTILLLVNRYSTIYCFKFMDVKVKWKGLFFGGLRRRLYIVMNVCNGNRAYVKVNGDM